MDDDDSYQIVPGPEELRRQAVGKLVECSIISNKLAEMEAKMDNLREFLRILDEFTPIRDDNGHVDILPVYREIRARMMSIACEERVLEERLLELRKDIENGEDMSNVKVIVKKL